MNGGEVVFTMSDQPNKDWAAAPEDSPRSPESGPYVPVPVISAKSVSFADSMQVSIASISAGDEVYYTLDGGLDNRIRYSGPFMLHESMVVKAAALRDSTWSNVAEATFRKFKPIGIIKLNTRYSQQYTAGGDNALLDGLRGVEDFRVGMWQGYEENDLEAVVDLGSVKPVTEVAATFLQDNYSWIFFPQNIRYEISQDGKNFMEIFHGTTGVEPQQGGSIIKTVSAKTSTTARYIKVSAKNIGRCPPWHRGAGGKAWLFVDEIEVR